MSGLLLGYQAWSQVGPVDDEIDVIEREGGVVHNGDGVGFVLVC